MLGLLEKLILDPRSEDAANLPLELTGNRVDEGHGIYLVEHDYPPGERKSVFVGGTLTEGQRRVVAGKPDLRRIPLKLWVAERTGGAATFPAATNLVTNPSFETNASGWATSSGETLTRVATGDSVLGEAVGRVVTNGGGAIEGVTINPVISVSGGATYSFAVWVKAAVGAALRLSIGETTGGSGSTLATFTGTGKWQRPTVSHTMGGGVTACNFGVHTAGTLATSWDMDGAQFIAESGAGPYFDGDTPGCAWSGTAHASTSTRPVAGNGKLFTAAMNELEKKVGKLQRDGGTLRRILPSGDSVTFDVIEAAISGRAERPMAQHRQEVDLVLTVEPLVRRPEVALPDRTTLTGPALIATETGIQGSQPALGRLVIDDDATQARKLMLWGIQSRHLDTATSAALFIECEDLTALGAAAKAAGPTGASGSGGNKVIQHLNLDDQYTAIVGLTLSSGPTSLTHKGDFRVIARVLRGASAGAVPSGTISIALEWALGDLLAYERNPERSFSASDRGGKWHWVDLGVVRLPPSVVGAHRWQGQIIARSDTPTDDVHFDWVTLIPISEASGQAGTAQRTPTSAASLVAADDFNAHSAGVLTGKTAQTGGIWAGSGDAATDFTIDTTWKMVTRTSWSSATGRYLRIPTTQSAVEVTGHVYVGQFHYPGGYPGDYSMGGGLLLRYVDTSNWLRFSKIQHALAIGSLLWSATRYELEKCVAGTVTNLGQFTLSEAITTATGSAITPPGQTAAWHAIKVVADAAGNVACYAVPSTSSDFGNSLISVSGDTQLASGGVLDDGTLGFYDRCTGPTLGAGGAGPPLRWYNEFKGRSVPTSSAQDAALAAAQSAQIDHRGYFREDGTGTVWPRAPHLGDPLMLPPAGNEGRSLRWIVLSSRADFEVGEDAGVADATSARMHYQPRDDVFPEPS